MVIRVVLAEDQAMVLGALAALLDLEDDIQVIAKAANGRDALRSVEQLNPDVLVTDIEMPGMTGLEVAAALKISRPSVRTVILTTFARPGYLRRALDSGARGYLLKDRPASELADAVRRVNQGLRVVDPALAAEAWNAEADPLTDRERQILQTRRRRPFKRRNRYRTPSKRRKPFATTSPKQSANSAPKTASMPRESHAPRAGCKETAGPSPASDWCSTGEFECSSGKEAFASQESVWP